MFPTLPLPEEEGEKKWGHLTQAITIRISFPVILGGEPAQGDLS